MTRCRRRGTRCRRRYHRPRAGDRTRPSGFPNAVKVRTRHAVFARRVPNDGRVSRGPSSTRRLTTAFGAVLARGPAVGFAYK